MAFFGFFWGARVSPGCPPVEAGEPDVDQRGGPATAFRRGPCLALVPAGGARGVVGGDQNRVM